ncbi:MBL fold metallo-hydrolase [Patescibacteria group bacterium]|nr:MBL fold metallo-hydrolase [Patescibacteria group bacterium]
MYKKRKIKFIIIGILAVAVFLVWSAYFSSQPNDKMKVYFFDVGQGDAAMIETPNRNQILIDGGPDNSILSKLGRVMPFYDRTIELVILTHPDSDHLAGLVEVMKNYEIGAILTNGRDCASAICQEFSRIVKQKNIKTITADIGQKIDFGSGVKMDILLPAKPSLTKVADGKSEDNNLSIISRLAYGADSFLFTGDAEAKEEMELISACPDLKAEVLKVAHHGSKNSTSELFLDKVRPKFSIISSGAKNRYGHPKPETLEKLKKIGAEILRTDLWGDIKLESEGKGVVTR